MCTHHWIIDSKDSGICKLCGQEKDFELALHKAMGTTDKLTPFERRIIMRFNVGDYYLQGHLDEIVGID